MLIFTYFILIGLFVGALIFRKKIMGATIGAIHKGALTLNNRVEEWGNKQITENPSSPVAQWRYAKQWKRAAARSEIYQKLREGKYGQKKDGSEQKKGAPGDADAPPPDDGKNAGTTENLLEEGTTHQANQTGGEGPETKGPEEPTDNVQTPVEGLEQMPENARESFGWRTAPDGQGGSQGKEDLEVFGPWDKVPQEARKPVKYDMVMEDGKKQTVYGSWENTPHGPVLRENYWSLERTRRAYRIMRDKEGKVFARNIDVDDAKGKSQEAGKQTAPQAPQNIRPTDYSAPEEAPRPQPGANHASRVNRRRVPPKTTPEGTAATGGSTSGDLRDGPAARGEHPLAGHGGGERSTETRGIPVKLKTTPRGRGLVDFGARYSPGAHPPGETGEKTMSETGFAGDEKTDVRTAGPNFPRKKT